MGNYWDFDIPPTPLIGLPHIGFDSVSKDEEIQDRTAQMIARSLNIGRVIAVVGSGISAGYGYPTWGAFVAHLIRFSIARTRCSESERGYLESVAAQADSRGMDRRARAGGTPGDRRPLRTSPLARADRFLVVLDRCEELCRSAGDSTYTEFRRAAAALIHNTTPTAIDLENDALCVTLRHLKIRRFLTTNYDPCVEAAFRQSGYRVLPDPTRPDRQPSQAVSAVRPDTFPIARSLHPRDGFIEELTQFAVAAPGYEAGVFHLHGDAAYSDSMVITEGDYRRTYLGEDRRQRAFRDALQVALTGNSLLFLGMGMEESDLLRPLREFVSHPTRTAGYEHPLFALLPGEYTPEAAREFRQFLYARYNVKALFYDVSGGIEDGFRKAVRKLASLWPRWWEGWQKKPALRRPVFFTRGPEVMIRHSAKPLGKLLGNQSARKRVEDSLTKNGAVLVLGERGAGKGSLGQDLVEAGVKGYRFDRRFFATAHFTNDFLSMVEAAARFFHARDIPRGSRRVRTPIEVLENALSSTGRFLLVIGGLDRLLVRPTLGLGLLHPNSGEPEYPFASGTHLTGEVADFLQMVGRHAARVSRAGGRQVASRIVLTSAMRPAELRLSQGATLVIAGPHADSLFRDKRFRGMDIDLLRQLRFTLRGHAYALSVIATALAFQAEKGIAQTARRTWLTSLIGRLSSTDLLRRADQAVSMACDRLLSDQGQAEPEFLRAILQVVALFTSPVTPLAVACTFDPFDRAMESKVQKAIEFLRKSNLLMTIDYEHQPHWRATAHTTVRNGVCEQLGDPVGVPGEAHRFDLAGWSSEVSDTLSENSRSSRLIEDSIESILRRLANSPIADAEGRHLARAAFGMVRSRWSATAIPRLGNLPNEAREKLGHRPFLDAYKSRLARLLNAIRHMSGAHVWTNEAQTKEVEVRTGVLYGDELAWLYNELGLTAYVSGMVPDAYALFRAAKHVNAAVEYGRRGYRWCESEINLGLVEIERGHLRRARYHLEHAEATAERDLKDPLLTARARGHLGLVDHLMGNYQGALDRYEAAIQEAAQLGCRRATSIFRRHRGDLHRKLSMKSEADRDLRESLAAAESGRHPDLVHLAMISRANLRRANNEHVRLQEMTPAIEFARRIGSPKLEWEALNVQSQIALEQGELELAGKLTVETLAIASFLGLRLRLAGSLYALGRLNGERGDSPAASRLFTAALQLATQQGNQLLIERAGQAVSALWPQEKHSLTKRTE